MITPNASFLKRSALVTSGLLAVALGAVPALAATVAGRSPTVAAEPAPAPASFNSEDTAKANNQRYCATVPPLIGSRLSRRMCKTSAEWAILGVEIRKTAK